MNVVQKDYSCDIQCTCQPDTQSSSLIVLTGGPGAGKTAVLEFARKAFCKHVAILPEAASILFGGGFFRLNSDYAMRSAQRTIFHIQHEMQLVARNEQKWPTILCDRGTLDGLAYWPGDAADFYRDLRTTEETEFAKYAAVIHLSTPSLTNGYNHQNPIRIETAEEASRIDEKIHKIWKNHPHYLRIDSSVHFNQKLQTAMSVLTNYLPQCCRERIEKER